MQKYSRIITIGLCPAWDTTCRVDSIDFGQHKLISSRTDRPAGKALNISRALCKLGEKNTAAGLWGADDEKQMRSALKKLRPFLNINFTIVPGATRQNITIVDSQNKREMHLRSKSDLTSTAALKKLRGDLTSLIRKNDLCVFAGSMPEPKFLPEICSIIKTLHRRKAAIALDTSGPALKRIINSGSIWLIKPNVQELAELIRQPIADTSSSLIKAARPLLEKVQIILISRGAKGALAINNHGTWQAKPVSSRRKALSTVGCGDYLLAGFIKALKEKPQIPFALQTAVKLATAHAWNLTENASWNTINRQVKVKITAGKSIE